MKLAKMKKSIGEFIHNHRIENGLTLTQLGAKLDIDSGALSKIENGKKRLDEKTLPKLAEVFELDLDELKEEYISEQIAYKVFESGCSNKVLNLAEEKIVYIKQQNLTQTKFKFQ
jgi:transcriptional regulator with XRE-family HTH domain